MWTDPLWGCKSIHWEDEKSSTLKYFEAWCFQFCIFFFFPNETWQFFWYVVVCWLIAHVDSQFYHGHKICIRNSWHPVSNVKWNVNNRNLLFPTGLVQYGTVVRRGQCTIDPRIPVHGLGPNKHMTCGEECYGAIWLQMLLDVCKQFNKDPVK